MMYESYYGFSEKPFQVAPNPKYLYFSSKHQTALTHLEYGITEGDGFILLTGEIGTGKTLLIKKLLSGIASNLEVAVIFSTNLNAGNLVNLVLNEFEIPGRFQDKAFALDALFQFLVAKFNENKRVILIIDEAQNLPVDALEEVRMMSNIQSDTQNLIQIVLVGQPELKKILANPALAALTQRIAWHYHLGPLSRAETTQYIMYRLKVAGRKGELFAVDALDLIYQASGGIPRTINILCENLLVYGFADEVNLIERPLVEKVLMDRSAITTPSPIPGEKSTFTPTLTEQQVNRVMERIWQLEKKISKFTNSTQRETEEKSSEDQIPHDPIPQPSPAERARPATVSQAAKERVVENQIPHRPEAQSSPVERVRSATVSQAAEERSVEDRIPRDPTPQSPPVERVRPLTVAKALEKKSVKDRIPRDPALQSPPRERIRSFTVAKALEKKSVKDRIPHSSEPQTSPAARVRPLSVAQAAVYAMDHISNKPAPSRHSTTAESPTEVVPAPRVPASSRATSPAVKAGWLVLTLLGIIVTAWLIISHTSQQPQQPKRMPPIEENAGLPSDQAPAPVTGTVPPPTDDVSAIADAWAPEITPPLKTSPLPSETAAPEENAQPPVETAGKPAARSVPSTVDKPDPADQQNNTALSEVAEHLRSQLQLEKLRSQLQLNKKIVIHFGDGSNELQPESLSTLTTLADLLSSQPDAQVAIRGFTDSSGVDGGIQKFGEFRANMVKSFLVARGIGADKIETYALDSPRPPLPKDTESGRRFNRRVEIEVILSPSGDTSQSLKP